MDSVANLPMMVHIIEAFGGRNIKQNLQMCTQTKILLEYIISDEGTILFHWSINFRAGA